MRRRSQRNPGMTEVKTGLLWPVSVMTVMTAGVSLDWLVAKAR